VGLVATVDEHTSVVLSWAHPEFRASAVAATQRRRHRRAAWAEGPASGCSSCGCCTAAVPRDVIVTSGLGGVSPAASDRRGDRSAGEEKGWDARTWFAHDPSGRAIARDDSDVCAPRGSDLRNALRTSRQRPSGEHRHDETNDRYRYPVIMTLLILLHFTVRSRLGGTTTTEADQLCASSGKLRSRIHRPNESCRALSRSARIV